MDVSDVVGALRRRWRIVVACALLGGAAVGLFLYTRNETLEATQYRVSVVILIPGQDTNTKTDDEPLPENLPNSLLVAQTRLALDDETRAAALRIAGLPPDITPGFSASLSDTRTEATLSVQSRDLELAEALAPAFAQAFIDARREVVVNTLRDEQVRLASSVATYKAALAEAENELAEAFGTGPIPEVQVNPETGEPIGESIVGLDDNLGFRIFERQEYRDRIVSSSQAYAKNAADGKSPSSFAEVIDRPPASAIVAKSSSPTKAVAGILAGGLVLGLVAALVRDRLDRSIRDRRRAANAFGAPVLASIPPRHRGDDPFVMLRSPYSEQSEAYRVLAASSVATDRLPRAIMVSSPTGNAHEAVAANFAAALATLGVRVALVATSPGQSWFLRPFTLPPGGVSTFPDLLALAQSGRLNGEVQRTLPRATDLPNLVVVPPGGESGMDLPFNGLPPLLEALATTGIDVTVIAGPAVLETADATIVAWATGSVMWAVDVGVASETEASEALARLELAGVKTFGVAVVEQD